MSTKHREKPGPYLDGKLWVITPTLVYVKNTSFLAKFNYTFAHGFNYVLFCFHNEFVFFKISATLSKL